jgi:hypothetical protein
MLGVKCYTEIKNTGHLLLTYTFQLPERGRRPTGCKTRGLRLLDPSRDAPGQYTVSINVGNGHENT